jgi:hypothetical protein
MGLRAISRWCEGCRNKGKAQLSSALDRISERITLASKTRPAQTQSGNQPSKNKDLPYISIGCGGESVSQSPLKNKAFSTLPDKNHCLSYGRKAGFASNKNLPINPFQPMRPNPGGGQCETINRFGSSPLASRFNS